MTRRRALLLPTLAALLLTACGTTVPVADRTQQRGGAGLSGPEGQPSTPDVAASRPSPGAGAPAGSGPAGAGASGPVAPVGPTSVASHGSGTAAPSGKVRTPVKLGFMTTDFSKAAAAFGFSGEADVFQGFKEMVSYLNAHGGLAGRTIQPDYFALDGASTRGSPEYQKACAHFTQDVKVEAVISDGNFYPLFEACMAKAGLLHLDVAIYGPDAQGQRQSPTYRAPTSFGVDRYSSALLETGASSRVIERLPQRTVSA